MLDFRDYLFNHNRFLTKPLASFSNDINPIGNEIDPILNDIRIKINQILNFSLQNKIGINNIDFELVSTQRDASNIIANLEFFGKLTVNNKNQIKPVIFQFMKRLNSKLRDYQVYKWDKLSINIIENDDYIKADFRFVNNLVKD